MRTQPRCPEAPVWWPDRTTKAAPVPRRESVPSLSRSAHERRPTPPGLPLIRVRPPLPSDRAPCARLAGDPTSPTSSSTIRGRTLRRRPLNQATSAAPCWLLVFRQPLGRHLDTNLRADLNDAVGRNLKIIRRIVSGARQADEQAVLPARHSRARR